MFTRADLTPGLQYKYDQNGWDFTKNLQSRSFCTKPFDTLSITQEGLVYACECDAWLPISVGNVMDYENFEDIMTNDITLELQKSIVDRTSRYCDVETCGFRELTHGSYSVPPNFLRHLNIGIDRSCNLSCPSCREELIFHKNGPMYEKSVRLGEHVGKLIDRYPNPLDFTLASDGELFASHAYAAMLKEFTLKPGSTVKIQTNGTLMKSKWDLVSKIEPYIKQVQVSMDAGTKATFEKIRRGGQWEKAIESIAWVIRTKKIPVSISIVVQPDNVHELYSAVQLYKSMGVSLVYLTMEQDWGTRRDFMSIRDKRHPMHEEFRQQLDSLRGHIGVNMDNSIYAFPDDKKASPLGS